MSRTAIAAGLAAICLALAAPAAVAAADPTVVADPAATQVTALAGVIVWVSGPYGQQKLMTRGVDGVVTPVSRAPAAASYRTVDLGYDRIGRLVATYLDCPQTGRCTAFQDDLRGHRAELKGFAPTGCELTTAPAYWRTRSVFGLSCRRGKQPDPWRSGVYLKVDGHPARRLGLPKVAFTTVIDPVVASVDLRGHQLAARVEFGTAELAVSETVDGRVLGSFLVADAEGDTGQVATGPVLGAGGGIWTLTDTQTSGTDPLEATIERLENGRRDHERLVSPPGPTDPMTGRPAFRATGIAVDGGTLYLLVPGTGVVSHTFVPS